MVFNLLTKMKKIKTIVSLLLVILSFTGCVDERVYYVPQTGTYIKTIKKTGDKYGYILFGSDSIMALSKDIDYVKSSIYLSAIFVLNSNCPDDIGIYSNGNVIEINQVKYDFVRDIQEMDTLYYEERYRTKPLVIKKPYFEFVITDYFSEVLIKESGIEYFMELKPIMR